MADGTGRMKIVSAQSFYWPYGYQGGVYVFQDSITGVEYVAFFRGGGVAVQTTNGKQRIEDR